MTLEHFSGPVADWFGRQYSEPTEAQRDAWPIIARGGHVLVSAPTGSGKTLTAFLWALDRLLSGAWEGGCVRVLYVSPLRALNTDIRRNLLAPLAELKRAFARAAREPRPVRVATRSGDTPTRERRAMLRNPPEILITTPESLNLLVTSPRGRLLFSDLECVILDEIHAVAGSKRGTHLVTAVERLVPLAGEFQRIALSATARPLDRMARFVGGYRLEGRPGSRVLAPRPIATLASGGAKKYEIEIRFPEALARAAASRDDERAPINIWEELTDEFKSRIRANRSTLVFANNRRTTEKLSRLLNEGEPSGFVYSHHGSLSREIRAIVERRLKAGGLKGLVATNSLELGIDIGALDEVLLVKTPPTVSSAVQRIGRAGHGVGEVSRGGFYPLVGRDLLDAAVVAAAVIEHDIEEIQPVEGALDVLAQVILAMAVNQTWQVDDLFDQVRTSFPYRHLSRRQFDLVLEMLTGRFAESRIRELAPRLTWDRVAGTVTGRRGTARLVYQSGGTIPDRGYFHLRLADSAAKLGELDEEFVWERSPGDSFSFGAQNWRIRRITHNDVLVSPAAGSVAMAPFWRAEERDRSFHLSARIGEFLAASERTLAGADGAQVLGERLTTIHRMEPRAARALVDLLESQRSATGAELPHRRHLLAEWVRAGGAGQRRLILHTGWGGRVNRPLAIALAAAWRERLGAEPELEHDNDCLLLSVPDGVELAEIMALVRSDNLEELVRRRLEKTGFFGARFRENAGRALLLPRSGRRHRVPLWLQRERGKKLLAAVGKYQDFPLVVETWRSCLRDSFDLEALKGLLDELVDGEIHLGETTTDSPSPLASDLVWKHTNRLMYADDVPETTAGASLSRSLLREVVFSSSLRPRIPESIIAAFERKLQRLHLGYAPRSAQELVAWVEERVLIPEGEWRELEGAIVRDRPEEAEELLRDAAPRLARITLGAPAIVAAATLPRLARALELEPDRLPLSPLTTGGEVPPLPAPAARRGTEPGALLEQLVAEWARGYGPFDARQVEILFGLARGRVADLVESLVAAETVVIDRFRAGQDREVEVCDAENLERLLRQLRARARPTFDTLPLDELPRFLAVQQGLARQSSDLEDLKKILDRLLLYPAPVRLWESEILPARLEPYYPEWLDSLFQESDLGWLGCGAEKICLLFPSDRELAERPAGHGDAEALAAVFRDPGGRYAFEELLEGETASAALADRLWSWSWQGRVANTTFAALRRGALNRFAAALESGRLRRTRRAARFDRWQSARPFAGHWFRVPVPEPPGDELEAEELSKERVRILLDRYGVLFRELLARELPALRWGRVFRSLRLMELAGEVVTGRFFADIPGPQFASRSAYRRLAEGLPQDTVFWVSAADPASPCGLGLEALRGALPTRLPSNHLVYHGARRVLTSRRGGARLDIEVGPDHPDLGRYLDFLAVRLTRRFDAQRAVDVETINRGPAAESPYVGALGARFELTRERSSLRLRRRY